VTAAALYGLYVVFAVLAGGVYLALPADRPLVRRIWWAGLIVGAAGLVGLAMYLVWWIGAGFEGRIFFVIFALLAIAAAIGVVTHRRPVYSAVFLVLVVLAVTGLCILAAAEFLAAALVIVYGGAILVTYIFVIMLAQQGGEAYYDTRSREPLAAVIMGFALMAATTQAMVATDPIALHAMEARRPPAPVTLMPADADVRADTAAAADVALADTNTLPDPRPAAVADAGNVRKVGAVLARDYMIAVQVAGILMLVAMVGAIAIARKKIDPSDLTEHESTQLEAAKAEPPGRFVEPFARVTREHR
jgi:NADH-quinone oxidoreductase subunit J